MIEANLYYIKVYKHFLTFNYDVKQIDEWSSLQKPSISQSLKKKGFLLHFPMNKDICCKAIILIEMAIDSVKWMDSKMTEWLLHKMIIDDMAFNIHSLNCAKRNYRKVGRCYDKKVNALY